jgi:hypothetical protein
MSLVVLKAREEHSRSVDLEKKERESWKKREEPTALFRPTIFFSNFEKNTEIFARKQRNNKH